MLISLLVFFASIIPKYVRGIFVLFWLFGLASCKDFKNWESKYTDQIKIQFEREKDASVPEVCKYLHSKSLESEKFKVVKSFQKQQPEEEQCPFSLEKLLELDLDPEANEVKVKIENAYYYDEITIIYERIVSLISPEIRWAQQQFIIRDIQFSGSKDGRPSIFKRGKDGCKIDHLVPLNYQYDKVNDKDQLDMGDKPKAHVTIYY